MPRAGNRLADEVSADRVVIGYRGLDRILRRTEIEFSPAPEQLSASKAYFQRILAPGKHEQFTFVYRFRIDDKRPGCLSTGAALKAAEQSLEAKVGDCESRTSNEEFNRWLEQSSADLHMMLTDTPYGLYPYAGVPWFSTAFGRDGILTALSVLWLHPGVARGCCATWREIRQPKSLRRETRRREKYCTRSIRRNGGMR